MSGTWKGADKRGGKFITGSRYTTLTDCPGCKHGTLDSIGGENGEIHKCADCDRMFKKIGSQFYPITK